MFIPRWPESILPSAILHPCFLTAGLQGDSLDPGGEALWSMSLDGSSVPIGGSYFLPEPWAVTGAVTRAVTRAVTGEAVSGHYEHCVFLLSPRTWSLAP